MAKNIKADWPKLLILVGLGFAWTKLGLGTVIQDVIPTFGGIIPNGTRVQYIPVGLTRWNDARIGIVTGTSLGRPDFPGQFMNLRYYEIDHTQLIQAAYVRVA